MSYKKQHLRFIEFSAIFFFYIKKSYKLRKKHQHDRRKYTIQTHELLSGEAHGQVYVPCSFYS